MRLAVFTSKYPARVSTFFERDMRALIEAGVEIDVFPIYPLDESMWEYSLFAADKRLLPSQKIHHLTLGESLRSFRLTEATKLRNFSRDFVRIGASATRYGIRPLAKTWYSLIKSYAWTKQTQFAYDHVLAYWGNYAATAAYAFHRMLDRPVPFSIWLHAGADLYETPIYLQQKLLYADKIVTCCAFNKTYLAKHHSKIYPAISDKVTVCYHGLDFKEFSFQPVKPDTNRIVAVGRLAHEKGFSYLLQAIHQLKQTGKDTVLDIVGDGEQAEQLKSFTNELGISDRVRFHGWLKFEDVRAVISKATMLVHPSDGLGDGLPNVIREAMAVGTPVIASDIAGIHEALDNGNCGLLVSPRDVQSLVNAIEQLLNHAELRLAFAQRARTRAEEKFDMWTNGRSLTETLRSVKHSPLNTSPQANDDLRAQLVATAPEFFLNPQD